jgi:hypothetical protein
LPRRIKGAVGPMEMASILRCADSVSTVRFSQPELTE